MPAARRAFRLLAWLLAGALWLPVRPAPAQTTPADSTAAKPAGPSTIAPVATLPDSVRSALTARHRRVPGSTFYVRPAAGYAPEESLNGLARPDGTLLEVVRVPNANFLKIRHLIVEQYLADRGGKVQEQRQLTFNGYPAVFGRGESLEPGKDLMVLAFGDSTGIELIFGLYPENDAPAEAALRQMLLTGYYDPRGKVPPLELAPFVIRLAGTSFQLLEVRPAERLYVFGRSAAADTFATRFTVQVLPVTPAAEARQRLQQLAQAITTPGATLQSQERQLLTAPFGYEISGQSRLRGRKNSFYQLSRTDDEATLLLHAVAFEPLRPAAKAQKKSPIPVAPPDLLAEVRKIAATVRMKR